MHAIASVSPLAAYLSAPAAQDGRRSAIDDILDAVRTHLGMEIAFASRFVDGRREFTHIRSDIPVPAAPGDSEPVEETFCHRILQGRLPELIHNAADHPDALDMPLTHALPVGAHLNVPLRLSDGRIYGTFCCLSRQPDYTLTERDMGTLRAFADLAAGQIERELTARDRQEVAREAVQALIDRDQLTIAFQPIHALADGRPRGAEALSRFPAGRHSQVPSDWFELAWGAGLGLELELQAVRSAIAALAYIPSDLYVSINVSPETAMSGEVEGLIAGHSRERLVVEITEHAQVGDYDRLAAALDRLRRHARIAIDDVGAGYAGLRHLVDLKPDILKLDMGLTRQVDCDIARNALAQAMVAFAARVGCDIVAEGIETPAEAAALKSLGVRFGQGFHFSRPMPAVSAQQYLLGAGAADPVAPTVPRPRRAAAR
jgi:EAL domain-containing protein (putative c-di-GMP-specific phosphodiesterase class I)